MLSIKYKNLKHILVLCACVFVFCIADSNLFTKNSTCFAEEINFEVTVDKTKVSLGSSIQLSLSFYGVQNIAAPQLPDIEGFDSKYLGPSSRMSIVNGKVDSSITHIYALIPLKEGQLTVPSFTVDYNGQQYISKAISVEVVQGPVSPSGSTQQPSAIEGNSQELEDRIFLVMEPATKRAYVNEIIPLKIKLYIDRLAIQDIQFPEFEHAGFSVEKFAEPNQYQEVLGGINYTVIEFDTNVFGLHPGQLQLGPANLQCNLMVKKQADRKARSIFDDDFFSSGFFGDLFSTYDRYPLSPQSPGIPIEIISLPEEGKPVDFSNALGIYNFDIQANPREVKVGDPITLQMRISGVGNLKTVNIPTFMLGDDFKVYEPQVQQDQTSKTFEQVIIPKRDDIKEIPEARFSFFNTKTGEYSTVTRGPIPIKVNPLTKGEELKFFAGPGENTDALRKKESLGRDIIYIKESIGTLRQKDELLCKNNIFIILQIFPLLAIISIFIFQKRRERLINDVRYARRMRAPRQAKKNLETTKRLLASGAADKFFDAAFKTLQEYLGDKLHLASLSITSNVVAEELEPRKLDSALIGKIKECFNYCDTARYAPSSMSKEQMRQTFDLLEEIIDGMERIRL